MGMPRFAGVFQGISDEVENVLIGQPIDNVLSLAAARNKSLVPQDAKALRNRGNLLPFGLGDFGNTSFATGEKSHNAKPGRLTEGPEYTRRPVQCHGAGGRPSSAGVLFLATSGIGDERHTFTGGEQMNTCTSVQV